MLRIEDGANGLRHLLGELEQALHHDSALLVSTRPAAHHFIYDCLHLHQQRVLQGLGNSLRPAEVVEDGTDANTRIHLDVVDGGI